MNSEKEEHKKDKGTENKKKEKTIQTGKQNNQTE